MTVAVLLADGTEEMEAVIVIDTLRRAGFEVTAVSVSGHEVKCSRSVRIVADALFAEADLKRFDVLVLPGGAAGAETMMTDERILNTVRYFRATGKLICAICAAPLVLQAAGVLQGVKATCHPSVASRLTEAERCSARVVYDAGILTSQGPGSSFEFALEIIRITRGEAHAARVREGLVLP